MRAGPVREGSPVRDGGRSRPSGVRCAGPDVALRRASLGM